MTRRWLALTVLAGLLAGAPFASAQELAPPRDGFVSLGEAAAGAAGAPRLRTPLRERLTRLQRTLTRALPGLGGLVPPAVGRLRLGVVLVALSDAPPAPWGPAAPSRAPFSRGAYARTPSGDPAHGSVADCYAENSGGALSVEDATRWRS